MDSVGGGSEIHPFCKGSDFLTPSLVDILNSVLSSSCSILGEGRSILGMGGDELILVSVPID